MRLWTFQSSAVALAVTKDQPYRASWKFAGSSRNKKDYEWMATQMRDRGIPIDDNPPIWAWHSCEKPGGPPTMVTARNLLSDAELESGVYVIELEAPNGLALLSSYSKWCDYYMESDTIPDLSMFDGTFEEGDDLQACLPFIMREWVLKVRQLNLASGTTEVDESQLA